MIDIKTALDNIMKAKYGRDVRQSIHDAIFQIDANANEAVDTAEASRDSAKAYAEEAESQADLAKAEVDLAKAESATAKTEADRAKAEADRASSVVGIGVATTSKAGIVKPDGTSITVDEDGTIHGSASVDIATEETAGIVKPDGETITIDTDGTLHSSGGNVNIEDITLEEYERRIEEGIITEDDTNYYNVTDDNEMAIATTDVLGVVKVDGDTITVDEDGTIHGSNQVEMATTTKAGIVLPHSLHFGFDKQNKLILQPKYPMALNSMFAFNYPKSCTMLGDTPKTVTIQNNYEEKYPSVLLITVSNSTSAPLAVYSYAIVCPNGKTAKLSAMTGAISSTYGTITAGTNGITIKNKSGYTWNVVLFGSYYIDFTES